MSQRPFKVLGVQQIAIGGPDKTRLQKLWVDMFGLDVISTFRSERENVVVLERDGVFSSYSAASGI